MRKTLPVLVASQISCEKQDRTLFQDIDLSIESGELVLLKGENGAGKTSLLRILVGLSEPTTGTVKVEEHCVHSDINLASRHFMYAGHKLGISSLLNPIENLQFWAQLQGHVVSLDNIMAILADLGLSGLEDLPVKNLSAGQQRRVSLAKLWLQDFANDTKQSTLKAQKDASLPKDSRVQDSKTTQCKLWVLDEPFTALDVNLVQQLEAHIAAFLNAGGAVIMTSHQAVSLQHRAKLFELEYTW
jgi:heme exporter protein A